MKVSGGQVRQGAPGMQLAAEDLGQAHLANDPAPLGDAGTEQVPSLRALAGCNRRGIWPLWPGARN